MRGFADRCPLKVDACTKEEPALRVVEDADVARLLPLRARGAYKWQSAVAVVAGSPGMTGAAELCAHAAYRAGAGVAVAAYHGKPRNPVLLAREHWPAAIALAAGDVGARPFLRAHPDLVTLVECADTGSPDDVDTPQDLARIAGIVAAAEPTVS